MTNFLIGTIQKNNPDIDDKKQPRHKHTHIQGQLSLTSLEGEHEYFTLISELLF